MKLTALNLAHLIAGVLLGLAACVLVAIHVTVPAFIPYASLTLIGIAGGLAFPSTTAASQPAASSSQPAVPVTVPVSVAASSPTPAAAAAAIPPAAAAPTA